MTQEVGEEMRWDLFISYASEDRDEVAVPLAEALRQSGLRVWLDRNELRLGDSLREKIDAGLAESNFGVVILSESYLAKRWPIRELNGLLAREEDCHPVILPVWHNLDKSSLLAKSPILADRIAANTSDGIPAVAQMIAQVVFDPARAATGRRVTTLAGQLSSLLLGSTAAAAPDPAVRSFLRKNNTIVSWASGSPHFRVQDSLEIGPYFIDFAAGRQFSTTGQAEWRLIILGPVTAQLAAGDAEGLSPTPQLSALILRAEEIQAWVRDNLGKARTVLPDLRASSQISIVFGRRAAATKHANWLSGLNETLSTVRVRTYDWLLEGAANIEVPGP